MGAGGLDSLLQSLVLHRDNVDVSVATLHVLSDLARHPNSRARMLASGVSAAVLACQSHLSSEAAVQQVLDGGVLIVKSSGTRWREYSS